MEEKLKIIVEDYPPNWEEIKVAFPKAEEKKAYFAYGDRIFNPFKQKITPDFEVHEMTHLKQQNGKPKEWWGKYIENKDFRLEQEIEAYGNQYKFIKINLPSKITKWVFEQICFALSGELYGNLLTFGEASSRIRHYARNTN